MSKLKQRFLLVSDMHYTTDEKHIPDAKPSAAAGTAFGKTQSEKVKRIYCDIMRENERSKLDAVLVLGDLSIDDYDYRTLPFNFCKKFKDEVMDRLPCPAYALPGNHDSYPNDIWKNVMGYDRRYSVEIGESVFIMDDSFANIPANPENPASGSPFTPTDAEFLSAELKKYPDRKVFLCSHYFNYAKDDLSLSKECRALIENNNNIALMFCGHTHKSTVRNMLGKTLVDIGGYGYSGQFIDGRYDFNIFDTSWAWGYQILEVYDDMIKTYHVTTDNTYIATNGVFDIEESVKDELILR